MLVIEHLHKSFGDKKILNDISLKVDDGEIVTIIGPSGTGKTTLLRSINFLERAEAGNIIIDDVRVDSAKATRRDILKICRRSGMVFQTYNLFRNKTVLENVMEGLIVVRKMPKKEAAGIAREQLEKVGMLDWENSYPSQISGGQQQRTAIARALAMKPSIILFDEPTSALDPEMSSEVLSAIKRISKSGITMLVVTHEIDFARDLSDRIIFMEDGVIVEEGPPKEIFGNPKQERTRQFIRKICPVEYDYQI